MTFLLVQFFFISYRYGTDRLMFLIAMHIQSISILRHIITTSENFVPLAELKCDLFWDQGSGEWGKCPIRVWLAQTLTCRRAFHSVCTERERSFIRTLELHSKWMIRLRYSCKINKDRLATYKQNSNSIFFVYCYYDLALYWGFVGAHTSAWKTSWVIMRLQMNFEV